MRVLLVSALPGAEMPNIAVQITNANLNIASFIAMTSTRTAGLFFLLALNGTRGG